VVSYYSRYHHYYALATSLKEEISICQLHWEMCPWHRWFPEEKPIFPTALSSAFVSKCRPWEGRDRGATPRPVTEEPIPSKRPEQHGCGHAICFQSHSQRNPPERPEKEGVDC
jgi:hypothetical protein